MAFLDFLKNLFKKKEPPPSSPSEAQAPQDPNAGVTVTPPVATPADPNSNQ